METIKNYLESMFMNMPNTAEVRRAKDVLWEMMEDKYTELIAEGKSENEAVATVISEFGNLQELAEELGINQLVNENLRAEKEAPRRLVTLEEANEFIKDKINQAVLISIGVLLCICCVVGPIICEALWENDSLGAALMFLMIAAGVALFVISELKMTKWSFLSEELCSIDLATTKKVKSERESYRGSYIVLQTIGIVFCIISVVPSIVLDGFRYKIPAIDDLSGVLLFLFVGIGVLMIVYANIRLKAYETLLKLNDDMTMAGEYKGNKYAKVDDTYYPWAKTVLELYYPTVTCIYLCWSFLTFHWHITWIIWPVAAIVNGMIKLLGKKGE